MGKYSAAARKARETVAKEHASIISSITSLKDDEIKELFPKRADKERLLELLTIVNESTTENKAKVKLIENIEHVAGTVIKLIKFAV